MEGEAESGDRRTGCVFGGMGGLWSKRVEGRFPTTMLEFSWTALSHNNWLSSECQISHSFTSSFLFFWVLSRHCCLPHSLLYFFLTFLSLSVSQMALLSPLLCFNPSAPLSASFTHGSGFGSVSRWFQLREVRISDRVSSSLPPFAWENSAH